jgi:hypothetical protein
LSTRHPSAKQRASRTSSEPALCRDPILDSSNEGVFTVDRDWQITSFNQEQDGRGKRLRGPRGAGA